MLKATIILTKIGRQDCLDTYKIFPLRHYDWKRDEETFYYPDVFSTYIFKLESKSFKGHMKLLGLKLVKLGEDLDFKSLIFLGDTKTAWLYQENNYKPVEEAQQFLKDQKVGKKFNGGLQIKTASLPVFIKHIGWLTRCNAALPYFHFVDERQNIVGYIHYSGDLRIDTLNENTDSIVKMWITKNNFLGAEVD